MFGLLGLLGNTFWKLWWGEIKRVEREMVNCHSWKLRWGAQRQATTNLVCLHLNNLSGNISHRFHIGIPSMSMCKTWTPCVGVNACVQPCMYPCDSISQWRAGGHVLVSRLLPSYLIIFSLSPCGGGHSSNPPTPQPNTLTHSHPQVYIHMATTIYFHKHAQICTLSPSLQLSICEPSTQPSSLAWGFLWVSSSPLLQAPPAVASATLAAWREKRRTGLANSLQRMSSQRAGTL